MNNKTAAASVTPVRQRTQYSCMACSMMMSLRANGIDTDEDTVNRVMGAQPMRGASWEQALACAQHYGMRATLTVPATVRQLKDWTDRGIPVMIAWNPEGRDWSHASVVFDVDDDMNVTVADPNIPDPDETVRVVPKAEFYKKWYEKWPDYLVRRPAMAIEREVTQDGRQVVASADFTVAPSLATYDETTFLDERNLGAPQEEKKMPEKKAGYTGNPGGEDIYPVEVDHGYGQPLSGGWDVMKRLQDRLLVEQGRPDMVREPNPRLATPLRSEVRASDDNQYEEVAAFFDKEMVRLGRKDSWWLPTHGVVVDIPLLGHGPTTPLAWMNFWGFTILPMMAQNTAYRAANPKYGDPEGLILVPTWHSIKPDEVLATLPNAKKVLRVIQGSDTVGEIVQKEMAWIETQFRIDIPTSIKARWAQEAPRVAARRWGVNDPKYTFVPLDGRKPVQLSPSAAMFGILPPIKAATLRVAQDWLAAKRSAR